MKKKTNIKTMIRKIVREEVAMAIHEVINELQKPTQSSQETISQPQNVQQKVVENKKFSNNSVLNSVLNETANFSEPIPNDTSVAGGTPQPTNVNQGVDFIVADGDDWRVWLARHARRLAHRLPLPQYRADGARNRAAFWG